MEVREFVGVIGSDFYTGVPDSQLRPLCDYLYNTYGIDGRHHIIAANEGNAVGIASGYHLATGGVPVVYMQNSGEGNAINPLASLMNKKVYGIPCIFVIGWRGEPGVHDEPQHIFQGEITTKLLDLMGVEYMVVSPDTTVEELTARMNGYRSLLNDGSGVAFVIRKDALTYDRPTDYKNTYTLFREDAVRCIVDAAKDDLIVCTTGKASRELFEIREARGEGHDRDFLTVGSMGHASSIALGIAMNTDKKVWCIDGDGAMLMHMGAVATIGNFRPDNLVHIIINNEAHETVGGMPTVSKHMEVCRLAAACGYPAANEASTADRLVEALRNAKNSNTLQLIEVKCGIEARANLGRPTTIPAENKKAFMGYMQGL